MNRNLRSTLTTTCIAVTIATMSGAVATAKPAPPQPLVSQLQSLTGISPNADTTPSFIRNSGTVAHVTSVGNTATIVFTAPDRGDCGGGVVKGTYEDLLNLPPTPESLNYLADIPGPDLFQFYSPSVIGSKYYPTIPPEQLSPHTVVATLPPGQYTVFTFCSIVGPDGETTPGLSKYYADEFTLPSATQTPTFGSS